MRKQAKNNSKKSICLKKFKKSTFCCFKVKSASFIEIGVFAFACASSCFLLQRVWSRQSVASVERGRVIWDCGLGG
jgi:hypothetical protein